MNVEPVSIGEKLLLWDMLQTYIEELSVYAGVQRVNGVYEYKWFDAYWTDEHRWPFWAKEDGSRAGFALILRDVDANAMRVGEFYIRPEFRRSRMGEAFALALLARFPGPWKIRQMAANRPAVAFWRRTLARYDYTEANFVDRDLERFEQTLIVPSVNSSSSTT
ncbi:MAG TPA: GNAT family N-acetyltransferase [Rhizomicrobium sp.]|nr:GNAT family N-acetyltransferase [Rhizomicrobium sp.]